MTDRRRATGKAGEALAARYLVQQGYQILVQNWRCRYGELDIVAQDRTELVFVEVRTRRSRQAGSAVESVTMGKRRRLAMLAYLYLCELETAGCPWTGPWRIDVVAVQMDHQGRTQLDHLIHAIEGDDL
ncbi:MAG: YraN family protein [Herpetosiphon sp.]